AEDGIRDRNVTGVQTCALPISGNNCTFLTPILDKLIFEASSLTDIYVASFNLSVSTPEYKLTESGFDAPPTELYITVVSGKNSRSEERRVGKECKYES